MNETLKVIISAEIGDLKEGVQKARKEIENFAKGNKEARDRVKKDFADIGDSCKKGFAVIGGAAVAGATALVGIAKSTEEYRAQQAQLTASFEAAGKTAQDATDTYNGLFRVLGDSGQATEAASHLGQLNITAEENKELIHALQGVYAEYGDSLPLEGLAEAVNHTAKLGEVQGPLADALEWSGQSVDSFNEQLAACKTEQERAQLITETLSATYGEAADAYEENAAGTLAQNEAQAKLDATMAKLGETMAPVITAFTEFASQILDKVSPAIQEFMDNHGQGLADTLTKIADAIGAVIGWIADNWDVIAPIAGVILGIAAALAIYSAAMGVVNAVMAVSPVTWIILGIVAAIAALVAIIVVVIKHWDKIKETVSKVVNSIKEKVNDMVSKVSKWFNDMKEKMSQKIQEAKQKVVDKFNEIKQGIQDKITAAKNKVMEIFNNIKSGITDRINAIKTSVTTTMENVKNAMMKPIEKGRDLIKGIVDKIKGFFSFTISFPKIKLPHFTISPSGWSVGDLLKGSIPKLGISWYAKGGIFDKPTLFGYGNGMLGGLGENGAEAVVPLEKNTQWLTRIADMLSTRMGNNQPIVLQVDGKTFAEVAVSSINDLTKLRGSLPLKIM